ncbi:MAG: putative membrane-spanning protein [Bacteroidetes bacterium]|nr:MAG: putative membrane-spanning protein [Bacteroidota bacterium]
MKKHLLTFLLVSLTGMLVAQPVLQWKYATRGRVYAKPLIHENRLYIGSLDSVFYALDKSTGSKIWEFQSDGAIGSSASISGKLVLFGSADGNLYALDTNSGQPVWVFSSGGEKIKDIWDYYLSSPVVSNGVVYWGSGDGHLYAIDADNGKLKWKYKTGGIVHADPLVTDSVVYIGSFDGIFYALSADKGEEIWKFRTVGDAYFPDGEIQKGAIIDKEVIYFGSRDYNIYALDAKTGRGRWNMKEYGSWIIATPLSWKGNLYFGTSDTHRFYCLRKSDGRIIWSIPLNMRVYGSAAAHEDIIWFGCFNGKLYGVNYATGKILYEFATDGCKTNYSSVYQENNEFRSNFELYGKDYLESEKKIHSLGSILSTPVIENDRIYFGSSDGKVYALKLK